MAVALFGAVIAIYNYISNKVEFSFDEEIEEEKNEVKLDKKLTKKDLIKHWFLGLSQECAYNYERLQATGKCAAMIHIIKKLYTTKEEISAALKRYLVFFNTDHFIGTLIRICASMEEQRANGAEITDETINCLKRLMGRWQD